MINNANNNVNTIEPFNFFPPKDWIKTNLKSEKDLSKFLILLNPTEQNIVETLDMLSHAISKFDFITNIDVFKQIERILDISWNTFNPNSLESRATRTFCLQIVQELKYNPEQAVTVLLNAPQSVNEENSPFTKILWQIYHMANESSKPDMLKNVHNIIFLQMEKIKFGSMITHALLEIFEKSLAYDDIVLQDLLFTFILKKSFAHYGFINYPEDKISTATKAKMQKMLDMGKENQKEIIKLFLGFLNYDTDRFLNEMIASTDLFGDLKEYEYNSTNNCTFRKKVITAFLYGYHYQPYTEISSRSTLTKQFRLIPLFDIVRCSTNPFASDINLVALYYFAHFSFTMIELDHAFMDTSLDKKKWNINSLSMSILMDLIRIEKTTPTDSNFIAIIKFQIALKKNSYDLVLEYSNDMLEKQCPFAMITRLRLEISQFNIENAKVLIELIEKKREIEDPHYTFLIRKVELLLLDQKIEEAKELAKKIHTLNPEFLRLKCYLLLLDKKYKEVEEFVFSLHPIFVLKPNLNSTYLKLFMGVAYYEMNKKDMAKKIFAESYPYIELEPVNSNPIYNTIIAKVAAQFLFAMPNILVDNEDLGLNRSIFEQVESAERANFILNILKEDKPSTLSLFLLFAEIMAQKNMYAESFEALKFVIEQDFTNKEAYAGINVLLEKWKHRSKKANEFIRDYHHQILELMD